MFYDNIPDAPWIGLHREDYFRHDEEESEYDEDSSYESRKIEDMEDE